MTRPSVPGVVRSRSAREGVVIDLFAGPGGWSEGLRILGMEDFGIEKDAAACSTRYAAGHATWQADLTEVKPSAFDDVDVWGLIASPPCQDFSLAGKRRGLEGERGQLVWVPLEWALYLRPEWIALEQVPEVLPIWRKVARELGEEGYATWTGILNAADFGVPQTRERAILIASRVGAVAPPEPTHAKVPTPDSMFGPGRLPWVTMAEALGWGSSIVDTLHGQAPEFDPTAGPARTMVKAARSWEVIRTNNRTSTTGDYYRRGVDEPSPTMLGTGRSWAWERPATTVCGDPRLSPPGYRGRPEDYAEDGTYTGKRSMDEAIKLSIPEALTLQGFRPDYPVAGRRTKQFEQVGNAIPPPLAAAITGSLVGASIAPESADSGTVSK